LILVIFGESYGFLVYFVAIRATLETLKKRQTYRFDSVTLPIPGVLPVVGQLKIMYLCYTPPFYLV
jgi:hypothetical protein